MCRLNSLLLRKILYFDFELVIKFVKGQKVIRINWDIRELEVIEKICVLVNCLKGKIFFYVV